MYRGGRFGGGVGLGVGLLVLAHLLQQRLLLLLIHTHDENPTNQGGRC